MRRAHGILSAELSKRLAKLVSTGKWHSEKLAGLISFLRDSDEMVWTSGLKFELEWFPRRVDGVLAKGDSAKELKKILK